MLFLCFVLLSSKISHDTLHSFSQGQKKPQTKLWSFNFLNKYHLALLNKYRFLFTVREIPNFMILTNSVKSFYFSTQCLLSQKVPSFSQVYIFLFKHKKKEFTSNTIQSRCKSSYQPFLFTSHSNENFG